ncbi:MAG: hypothetical protein SGPRY_006839, partial [Prymnesium sp.]
MARKEVITTEWINGVQLAKCEPAVINKLIPVGVNCFLAQLLDVGFFHSDPHPGNLLVDQQGRLVLIDFGLCAEVDQVDGRSLASAIVHLMRSDVEGLVEDGVKLDFLPADIDRSALLPPLQAVFNKSGKALIDVHRRQSELKGLAARSVSPILHSPSQLTSQPAPHCRKAKFGAISRELNQIFFDFPFTVPPYFALITRALIVLEGIAVTGDPNFDLFTAAYPYAARHASK